MKTWNLFSLLFLLFMLSGCLTLTPMSNQTNLQEVDFTKTFKTGEACATYYLGFIGPYGDTPSLVEAAKAGDITTVEVVEYRREWHVIFAKHCLVVHGQ